jgi:hypothetical protein
MNKKIVIATFALATLLYSCKPELKGSLGDPADKIEGMEGNWELSSFIQQDPNNPIKEERDLSEFYVIDGQTPYNLRFTTGKTYEVITGPGRNYFGTGGTWAFDNDEFPTTLFLYSPADTLELELGNVVRPTDNTLGMELTSYCEDAVTGERTTTAVYKFIFNRVN